MKKINKIRTVSIVALALVASLLALCLPENAQNTPAGTVRAFHIRLSERDFDGALECIEPTVRYEPEFSGKAVEMFSETADSYDDRGGLVDVESLGVEYADADHAYFRARLVFGSDEPQEEEGKLLKVDGRWFISFGF